MNYGAESETVEFKESTSELKEGIRSLASMLNKWGKGTLYFGVKDNGEAIGQQIGKKTIRDISQAISTAIEPNVIPSITVLRSDRDDFGVIKIDVEGSDIPYSAYGQYLIRSADEDKKASRGALRSMFIGSGVDFLCELKSNRGDLTFEQFTSLLVGKGYHITSFSALEKSKGLRNSRGEWNLMAFLLSDQSNVSIKVARFLGKDKTVLSQRKEFGNQCLILAMQQAMDYVETLNETNVVLGYGPRKETPLFKNDAFEEAWKNACVHNLWIELVPPAIYIYSDRVEIISTGGLPFQLDKEEFFSGTSRPINKALWSIFSSLDYAEQTGHGVPTIVSEYGQEAFSISDNFIRVTLPFAFQPVWALSSQNTILKETLSEKQKQLLEAISENPFLDGRELSEKTGMALSSVKRNIKVLKDSGKIKRMGSKKSGHWVLMDGDI